MLTLLIRRWIPAVVVLLLLTASSALGARALISAHASRLGAKGSNSHSNAARQHGNKSKHDKRTKTKKHKKHQSAKRIQSRKAVVIPPGILVGDSAVEAQRDYAIAGQSEAFRLQAGSSGAVGAAHVYIGEHNSARTIVVGLYGDSAGHPESLLSKGSVAISAAGAWQAVALSPAQLTAGDHYWLAVLGLDGTLRYRDRAQGSCPSQTSSQTNLSGLPGSWSAGAVYSDCPISAYVTADTTPPPVDPPPVTTPTTPTPPPVTTPTTPTPPPVTTPTTPTPPTPPTPPTTPPVPTNVSKPTINGNPIVGQPLTAMPGHWTGNPTNFNYQWQDCDALGTSCLPMSDERTRSYTPDVGDVGGTVRVRVDATNAGGTTGATSAPSDTVDPAGSTNPPPPPAAPSNTALPTVSGTATAGDVLTAGNGSWSGSPTSYARQWQSCDASGANCANVSGSTGTTYTLDSGDVGNTLRVRVTATNAGGSTAATSDASDVIAAATVTPPPPPPAAPSNTALPTVSGTATAGDVLTAGNGSWSGSPTSYARQWESCDASGANCANVSGSTGTTYTLDSGDVGNTLRVRVTATNAGGSTAATSDASDVIAAATVTPPPPPPPPPGSPSPACTTTVSSVSSASSDVASAGSGAVICLTAGSYGQLSLSGSHAGNVTVESVPGSAVTIGGASFAASASNITLHNFTTSEVDVAAGASHITIDHNDISGGGEGVNAGGVNCSVPNAPTYSGCTPTPFVSYLTISNNKIHGYGNGSGEDAVHLNNWQHVTVTGNDIYGLEEHGNHTDALQSVFGGSDMVFDHNYEHDNQSQGFFLKDGDVSNVTVSDNLFLRNNNEPSLYPGGENNIQVFNTSNFVLTNNTSWDGQGDLVRADGAAAALTVAVNHNVDAAVQQGDRQRLAVHGDRGLRHLPAVALHVHDGRAQQGDVEPRLRQHGERRLRAGIEPERDRSRLAAVGLRLRTDRQLSTQGHDREAGRGVRPPGRLCERAEDR